MPCDDALQEHNQLASSVIYPLKYANFCWKSANYDKWKLVIDVLMIDSVLNYDKPDIKNMIPFHMKIIRDED